MKNGFYSDLNRGTVLRGARRCMALLLALLMLVPANLATVLAEGTAGAQETRTLRYVGDLSPHKHTKDCRNKDGKRVCGIVEGEYYHEHNQYCRDEAGNLVCGLKEKKPHHHTDSCYKEEKKLVCGLEETAGHQHGEGCYTEKRELTCGLEETAGHQHGADCYTRTLTCGLEETVGHQHGEGCYERRLTCTEEHEHTADCPHEDVLVCGKAEGEGAHAHTDACYTDALTCGKAEGEGAHAHGGACYTVIRELTCGLEEGAGAHAHTDDCWKTSKVLTCSEGEPVVVDGVTFKIQTLTSSASDWKEEDVTVQSVAEELTEEEPAAEEPVAEETIAEETAEEDNIGEESAAEETAAEDSAEEETVAEEAVAEETATEETVVEEPAEEETAEAGPAEEIVEEAVEAAEAAEAAEPEDRTFEYAIRGAQEVALSEVFQALEVVADGEWAGFAAGIEAVEVSNPEALWLEETENDWTLRAMREPGAGDALTAALADGSKITVEITAYGDTEASAKNDAVVISTVDDMYLPEEAAAEAVMPAAEEAPAQMLDVPDPGEDAESVCRVFDIELANVDAQEYEGFDVAVNLDEDVVGADFKLYQVQGDVATDLTDTLELNSQVGADGLESVSGFTFRTDDFAQFVLCYSLETYYKTVEGETFKITVNFDEAAQIPFGAELKVREIEPGEADFQRYLDDSAAQLGVQSADVTFARFFDIEIVKDGEKVEPKAPVQVTIAYQDALELGEEDQLNVVHFADAGTEVISDVSVTDDGTEITYEQGSFSVTGTVVTAPPTSGDGQQYALVVKYDDKYYCVLSDGSLSEVTYFEDSNTVSMDYAIFWTYARNNANGTQVDNLLLPSEASGFDGNQLPKGYYYRYIDPNVASGRTDEPKFQNTDDYWYYQAEAQHPKYFKQCAIVYSDNHIKARDADKYIGVDAANHRICGNVPADQAAEVYLATVTSVPKSGNIYHTVNHIDISIEGKASVKKPLIAGEYWYQVNGEWRKLEVSKENPVTLNLEMDKVPIDADDMKKSVVTAYSAQSGLLNDAFYITGYSQNQQNSLSTVQVRLEGSFKVADLDPYYQYANRLGNDNDNIEDAFSREDLQRRLDNRIYYTVTVSKELTFDLEYEYETGKKAKLYSNDDRQHPLTTTSTLNLSKSFDYWDEGSGWPDYEDGNECPPVTWHRGKWQQGQIIWDTSKGTGSGMDFKLVVAGEGQTDDVAIDITKTILSTDGTQLHPDTNVLNQFTVYQKTNAGQGDWDSVVSTGVGSPAEQGGAEGYKAVHSKSILVGKSGEGTVFDYDVDPGMTYIEEDKDSIPKTFTDTSDKEWHYVSSYIDTEYAWRQNGDENKLHTANGLKSIPDVLGHYRNGAGNDLNNGFLDFYVYNVYTDFVPHKQEIGLNMADESKKIAGEGTAYYGVDKLGAVKPGDEITYEISYKNYRTEAATVTIVDKLDENVEYVSASEGGAEADGTVTWTLENVAAGTEGKVTLTVKVTDGAKTAGKVVNGGDTATVQVGNDEAFTLETVENPVPEPPTKKETAPYEGTGVLGGVKVGDEITYEISYKNYKTEAADIVIVDTLDENVEFVSASDEGAHSGEEADGVVTWTLEGVEAGTEGTVTLKVKVLEGALESNGGPAKVVNGGENATVKVGNDQEYNLNEVENPVPEVPQKKETAPYEGTGVLGGVKVGDEITYTISFKNYKQESTTVTIVDKLDPNVKYVDDSVPYGFDRGVYDKNTHTVTWTLNHVAAGREDTVTLIVKVLEGALESKSGPGKVVNGGENATVKVGEDHEYTLNTVENPVPEPPEKKETAPYEGTGTLGAVKPGDTITYEISFKNYKAVAADVVIRDTLDSYVKFVSADNGGQNKGGTVKWTIKAVPAGQTGTVTLTVQVLDTALESHDPKGPGKVVNGGDTATVQVGNDQEFELNTVENPVPELPHKQEIVPEPPTGSDGTGVLGAVQVDDEITYKISYRNYKAEPANVVIKDELDTHVEFVEASDEGQNKGGTVEWTIASVPANTEGFVTLTVKVLESAKVPNGPGMVVNGGDTATVKVGNDNEYTLEKVVNPVLPSKQEVAPYEGLDDLGAVKVGDEITYEIHYVNYTDKTTDIVIVDTLDANVKFVEAGNRSQLGVTQMVLPEEEAGGQMKWELKNVPVGGTGTVYLTVQVLATALVSHDPAGPGKVVNGGDGTTIMVGDKPAIKLNTVENPVPEPPHKQEIAPYEGTDELGAVQVGSEITYEIRYRNYKTEAADIVIADTLDKNVEFVSASDSGWNDNGVVRWTLKDVPKGEEGTVTLTVKVLEGALKSKGGLGEVVNGGSSATVKVGNDNEFTLEEVSNPVPESPEKRETMPTPPDGTEGKGLLDPVKVGDQITYTISFKNYKKQDAKIVVKDQLDEHVKYVSSNSDGLHDGSANGGVVIWTFDAVPADGEREVTVTVEVLPSAQVPEGPGKVVNGGDTATVQVDNDMAFKLDTVENPVPPVKRETAPYDQTQDQELGAVKVGDEITYKIFYANYLNEAATITIKDKLDAHVEFVEASDGGVNDGGVVEWAIADVPAGEKGSVTLKVKVLDTALESHNPKGPGKVVNGGEGTTVKVGNHHEYTLEPVENPVPEEPLKQETAPYDQTKGEEPGAVKVGDVITYTISYKNYKTDKADVIIKDTLDEHVSFESASDEGAHSGEEAGGVVTWTLKNVEAGKEGTVSLTVKVLEGALESKGGQGKVVNGGETATVKVGNDHEYTLNEVENPVPETPTKQETAPYDQTKDQELGAVKVGDTITYTISFTNYKKVDATVTIVDALDKNVEFVEASDGGKYENGVVTWTLENVKPGMSGTVTLTVKVLEGALESKNGPGKVVNGGGTASVQVDNDQAYTLNEVENPVPEPPEKKEIEPYEGTGVLGGVKVGEKITYEISYRNYNSTGTADIEIVDKLDGHVAFSEASDGGKHENGVVTWTLKNVEAGKEGKVTLTVVVLEGALQSMGGKGKVVNGGDTATVKVGNDNAYTLNEVENPVPEPPEKKEITPFEGTGLLGAVKAGQEITYEISYKNYKAEAATVAIKDTLDEHVEFVSASDDGAHDGAETGGVVNWKLGPIDAGKTGKVTLTVRVLESAEVSNGGPGKVINGGDTATVQVGEDHEYTLNTVVNPLLPQKQETAPYEGNGVLGGVKVDEEITYEIFYANYLDEAAEIVIKDTLDENVAFVEASDDGAHGGEEAGGVVTWTLKDVEAGKTGKVTLTVKVLEGALESNGGPGKVVNGGDNATVKVGNDQEYTLNEVENPVPEVPNKQEIKPYEGNGVLGGVKVGEEITYEISYKNYKADAADIVIKDTLDKNVEFVDASNDGEEAKGVVTWTLKAVPAGKEGKVTLTVKVLESALESNGGPAKVVNGGENATVKVGEDHEYTLNEVENPVPEVPNKQEVEPYKGIGVLGGVKVDDEIAYEISYKNYKAEAADIVIVDTLDKNVEFVSASDDGEEAEGVVTWTLKAVPAGKEGKVTLKVKALKGALKSNGGPGKVVNGGENATVKVGEDHEYTLNEVENPVVPGKHETAPYKGTGVLGPVKVGDEITYAIDYRNYKADKADIVIKDKLDKHVEFVSATDDGVEKDGVVTWTLKDVPADKEDSVYLTVRVLESARIGNGGPGKVLNGGDTATVKVGNDDEYSLNEVENPVVPNKQETAPYKGNGVLGGVKVGDVITYTIGYRNYKAEAADIVITDTLDKNVEFVSASDDGVEKDGVVTWTLKAVPADKESTVTLKVKVLEGALKSNGGPAKVVNGGDNATVQVGDDPAYTLNEVENPVPEAPYKREVVPYKGDGVLGAVKVGEEITYEISYRNYKNEAADIVIVDTLDKNVAFVSASDKGVEKDGVVTWTLEGVEAGKESTVTLTVKVLEGALKSNGGPAKVVNGGDNATVQVGNDAARTLNEVENPVPERPNKQEVVPYKGNGVLGAVKVGDEITYEINYRNYKTERADIVIVDTLDKNVEFVSASDGGKNAGGAVTWTIKGVEAGKEGKVTLTVKVLKGALKSNGGPGKVVNGGDNATVQVGNDNAYTLNQVENPVPEAPQKREVKPYKGTGKLGSVKVGDTITYEISYRNYKTEKADIVIVDTLDKNVQFVSASDGGVNAKGVVTWTLKDMEAGKEGKVTLKVKVLEGALKSNKGPGKVVNGGDNATVKVGNDNAYTLNQVENPVSDPTTGDTTTTTTQTTTLTGHKIWDDEGDVHGLRPQSITLQLLADGTPVSATPEWSDTDTDDWTFTYRNLRATTGSGITIHYTVQEVPVEGYECEINGMTITNHLIPREPESYVDLSGVKTWVDDDNADGKRPEAITVRLYRDGQVIDVKKVTEADGWKYSFGRLPADDGFGKVFTYVLREDGVEGYYARYNGMNVTNTLLPETPQKEPIVHKGTPRPDFSKFTETMWDELLELLGYDTPLFGMLATGDETPVYPYVFGGIGALAMLAWLALERRKRRAAKQ